MTSQHIQCTDSDSRAKQKKAKVIQRNAKPSSKEQTSMADNQLGVKTRAMIEKEGVNLKDPECQQVPTNPETTTDQQPQPQPHQQPQPQLHPQPHNLDTQGAMQNPRVELTRIDQNDMEEYVRKYSDIGLNWYVPNLLNTRIIDLIRNKTQSTPERTEYCSTAQN